MNPIDKKEIEDKLRNGYPYGVIVKLFLKRMTGIKIAYQTAYNTVKVHHLNHLIPTDAIEERVDAQEVKATVVRDVKWDDVYKEIKKTGLDYLRANPDKIKISDIIAAENVQTGKERLKLQADSLQLFAAKFFSGIMAYDAKQKLEGHNVPGQSEDRLPPVLPDDAGDRIESDSA